MNLQRAEAEYNSADAERATKHHYNKKEVVIADTHNNHNLRLLKCEIKSSPLKILYAEMHKLQVQHGIELLLKGVKAYNDELCCTVNNDSDSNQCVKSEYYKNLECFERWLDVCDGVNFTDSYGNTLLHWVCAVGYVDAAAVLLRAGLLSSLEARNVNGATPLLCAAATATNAEAMIQFLISHGAHTKVHTSRSAFDTLQSLLALRNMLPIYERIIESCEPVHERAEWNEKCGLYVENIMSFAGKLGTREAAREFVYFYHHYNGQEINKRHDEHAHKWFREDNCHNVIGVTKSVDLDKENTSVVEETKESASTTNEEIIVERKHKEREKERECEQEKEDTSASMLTNNSLLPAALLPYAKQKLDHSPTLHKLSSNWANSQHGITTEKTTSNNNRNFYRYAQMEEEELEQAEEEEECSANVTNFALDVANGNDDIGKSAYNGMLFVKLEESLERMRLERNYWQEFAVVATKWGNVWRRRCFMCSSMEVHNQEQEEQKEHHDIQYIIGSTGNQHASKKRDVDKENDNSRAEKPVQDKCLESQILAVLGERYDADGTRVLLLHVKETALTEADINNISCKQCNVQSTTNNSIIGGVEENQVDIYKEDQNALFCVTVKWMPLALVQNNEVVQRYCNKYDKTYFTLTPTIMQRDEASRPLYSSLQKPLHNKNNVKSHIRCYEEEELLESTPLACSSPDDRLSFESSPLAHMGATERAELEEELRRIPRRTLSPEKVINSSSQPLLSASTLFRLQKFDLPNEALPCLSKEMLLVGAHDTTTNSAQVQNERCNDISSHHKELLQEEKRFAMEPQLEDINMNNVNQQEEENISKRETREVQIYDIDCISPTHFNSTEKPDICKAVCNTESVNCEIDEVDDPYRLVMDKPHACAKAEKKNKNDDNGSDVLVIGTSNTTSNNVRSNNKDNSLENVMEEELTKNHEYVKENYDSARETESSASRRAPRITHVAAEEPVSTNNYLYAIDKCGNNNLNTAAASNHKEEQRLLRERQQEQHTNNNNIDKIADQSAAILKKDNKQFLSTMEKASYEEFLFHSALEVLERRREKAKKTANVQGTKKGKGEDNNIKTIDKEN